METDTLTEWWTISGAALLELLRRVHDGEEPDLVYAEAYANAEHESGEVL